MKIVFGLHCVPVPTRRRPSDEILVSRHHIKSLELMLSLKAPKEGEELHILTTSEKMMHHLLQSKP